MPHVLEQIDHETSTWRTFLLHNKSLHLVLIVLLGIDGLICLVSGVLEKQYYHGKSDDCLEFVEVCGAHRRLSDPLHLRFGADLSPVYSFVTSHFLGDSNQISERKLSSSIDCNGHPHFGNHTLHDIEIILAYISIGILSLFLVEQFLLMLELKCEYWKQPLFVMDFLVITASLVIEIVITNVTLIGLLVLARMWRFARIGHGVFEATHMYEESFIPEDSNDEAETINNMKECWDRIDDRRWDEICKNMSAEVLESTLTKDEKDLAEMVGRNPAVALRALAFAQAYKHKMDSKVLRKHIGAEPSNGDGLRHPGNKDSDAKGERFQTL